MGLLFFGHSSKIDDQAVLRAKQDVLWREELLATHRDWVLRVLSRACRRVVREQDDEFSIGLLALNEAIDSYQVERAAAFTTFAEQVIRRRLIDWQRKENRRPEVVWSGLVGDEESDSPAELITASASQLAYQLSEEANERQMEILRLDQELKSFGVRFGELPRIAPKHKDARRAAMQVAQQLAERADLMERLQRSRSLPLQTLQSVASVSRKTLERQRKYIITLAIILVGDYPLIRSFIEWPRREEGAGHV